MEAVLTPDRQIAIPELILEKLNLSPGDRLQFVLLEDGTIFLLPPKQPITRLKGMLPKPAQAVRLAEMEQAILEGAQSGL